MLALVLIKTAAWFIPENWAVHPSLLLGGIPGSFLMAAYLWFANAAFFVHDQEVLSTQAIEEHKCFARFKLTEKELTIYPIGLERVCKKWDVAKGVKKKEISNWNWRKLLPRYQLEAPEDLKRIFVPAEGHELSPRLIDGLSKIPSPRPKSA